ncbi:MAG: hypothetical protein Q9216_004322 [Gyalolechia sp. 2 TL-2023]
MGPDGGLPSSNHAEKSHGSWITPSRVRSRPWRRFRVKSLNLESALNEYDDKKPITDSTERHKFLAAVGGDPTEKTSASEGYSIQQQTYLRYVEQRITTLPTRHINEIMGVAGGSHILSVDRTFTLLARIAKCISQENHFSIEKAMDDCIKSGVLSSNAQDGIIRDKARVVTFSCVAWISMLYPPVELTDTLQMSLAIDPKRCACMLDSQSTANASLPICEVIEEFGSLLPTRQTTEPQCTLDPTYSKELLYVSLLNAEALSQIGGIEIVWVDYLSSHLVFDPELRKVFIFRLPSFCYVNRFRNSAFAKIIEQYYDNFNKPGNFTSAAFMKEIRRSYGLIFSDDSRARAQYFKKEQKRARCNGVMDPYLNILCTAKRKDRVYAAAKCKNALDVVAR